MAAPFTRTRLYYRSETGSRYKSPIDVPTDLAPIIDSYQLLECAIAQDRNGADVLWKYPSWHLLLLSLWFAEQIELWGCADAIDAPLKLIEIPVSERWPMYYDVAALGHSRLVHNYEGRRRTWHGLQWRAAPEANVISMVEVQRRGATDRARAELMYQVAKAKEGSTDWPAPRALREALAKYPGHPLLGAFDLRVFREAWRIARQHLRMNPRPDHIVNP